MRQMRLDFEHGSLIEHARNPTLVDCRFVTVHGHRFWMLLDSVSHILQSAGVKNYQLIINKGHAAVMFKTALQIKLFDAQDKELFLRSHKLAKQQEDPSLSPE